MTAYHTSQSYAEYCANHDIPPQYPYTATTNLPPGVIQSNCQYPSNTAVAYYPMQSHYYPLCYPHIQHAPRVPLPSASILPSNHIATRNAPDRGIAPNDILFERYAVLKRIGEGTFGDIWKVMDIKDATHPKYAIKTLKMDATWSESKRERLRQIFTNEGRRIHALNNIITEEIGKHFIIASKQCIGPYIVMELSGHSLLSYMEYHAYHHIAIPLRNIRVMCIQILSAMSFIHGIGQCMHCDLKPENILIQSDGMHKIKIIDFGNAMAFNKQITSFDIQTLWYRAPEILFGNSNDISSLVDMWSVGCIVYELCAVNNGKHERLFKAHKFDALNVICKIYQELHSLPQCVYNEYTSYHYPPPDTYTMFHDEASYVKAKTVRSNKLWFKLAHAKRLDGRCVYDNKEELMYFVDMLSGLLDPNPWTRYTSEDAIRHPFTVYGHRMDRETMKRVHPYIPCSDDTQRQQRMNEQRRQYQLLVHDQNITVNKEVFPRTFTKQNLY
eukprot:157219_1